MASSNVRITVTSSDEELTKFWHHFSKVAKTCYLTLLRASPDTWAEHGLDFQSPHAAQIESSAGKQRLAMRDFNESLIRFNLCDEELSAELSRNLNFFPCKTQ